MIKYICRYDYQYCTHITIIDTEHRLAGLHFKLEYEITHDRALPKRRLASGILEMMSLEIPGYDVNFLPTKSKFEIPYIKSSTSPPLHPQVYTSHINFFHKSYFWNPIIQKVLAPNPLLAEKTHIFVPNNISSLPTLPQLF